MALDYESELLLAIEKDALEFLSIEIKTKSSKNKLQAEIISALEYKKNGLIKKLSLQNLPQHIIEFATKQIDAEKMRELFELKAAFSSILSGWQIFTSLKASMVEGQSPSIFYTESLITEAYSEEIYYVFEALGFDITRNRFKSNVYDFNLKEANTKRLLLLEKAEELQLQNLYLKTTPEIEEELNLVISALKDDYEQTRKLIKCKLDDNLNIQASYNTDLKGVTNKFEEKRSSITETIQASKNSILSKFENNISEDELYRLDIDICRQLMDASYQYQEELYNTCNNYFGRMVSISKLDDNLRSMQQIKQQDSEAKYNALNDEIIGKIDNLTSTQKARREEARSIALEHEIHLVGLKSVLQTQADKQKNLLKEKLKNRKNARVKQLIDEGVSENEAESIAANELRSNDEMQTKELEKAIMNETSQKLKISEEQSEELKNLKNDKGELSKLIESGLPVGNKWLEKAKVLIQNDINSDIERINLIFEKRCQVISNNDKFSQSEKDEEIRKATLDKDKYISAVLERQSSAIDLLVKGGNLFSDDLMKRTNDELDKSRASRIAEAINSSLSENEAAFKIEKDDELTRSTIPQKVKDLEEYIVLVIGEGLDQQMRSILLEHKIKLEGLQNVIEYQKTSSKANLRKRLNRKIKEREKMLTELTPEEKAAIINEEFKEDKKKIVIALKEIESNAQKDIVNTQKALETLNTVVSDQINSIVDKESSEFGKIIQISKTELENNIKANKDEKAIELVRLAGISSQMRIDRDLVGIRDHRDRDIKALKKKNESERKSKESEIAKQLLEKKSISEAELSKLGLSKEEIENKLTKEFEIEKAVLIAKLNSEYEAKLEDVISKRVKESKELEKNLIDAGYDEAEAKSKLAAKEKDDALAHLEQIKLEQASEQRKLEDRLSTDRISREQALKNRLAEKRNARLKLSEHITDENEKNKLIEKIILDEQLEIKNLHKSCDEYEEQQRKEHQEKVDKIYADALKESRKKEIEAAEAIGRETALRAAKEMEDRASEEIKARELKRLKDAHLLEAQKQEKENDLQKSKGHSHLKDRLAEKRARAEKKFKTRRHVLLLSWLQHKRLN